MTKKKVFYKQNKMDEKKRAKSLKQFQIGRETSKDKMCFNKFYDEIEAIKIFVTKVRC